MSPLQMQDDFWCRLRVTEDFTDVEKAFVAACFLSADQHEVFVMMASPAMQAAVRPLLQRWFAEADARREANARREASV